MATVKDAITKIWIEDLAPGVKSALLELDPTFSKIRDSNMGVTSSNIGRDWKVKHTFVTGLAGKLRAYNDTGETDIYGASTDPSVRVDASSLGTFPALDGTPIPGYMQSEITLKRWKGNTFIPSQYLRADQLDSVIASSVATILKQTALMIATNKANNFFSTSATTKQMGTISSVTSGGGTGVALGVFVIGTSDRIRKFQPGLEIDIYESTATTKRNASGKTLVITAVDPITNSISVTHADGSSVFASQVAADDVITMADSKGYGPAGLNDYFVSSGTISPVNISTTTYPQFKSIVVSNMGQALTEADLRKYVGAYLDIFGTSRAPDTLLTTQGVLNAYVGETDDMWMFGVQGQPLKKEGGFELGSYNYDGKAFQWQVSPLVQKGTLYGLRLNNNWKRYVPPRLPSAGTNKFFNNDIEFVAPLGGASGIWLFVTSNGAVTDWSQAPFECVEQYVPEIIQGIKFSGLSEDYATS